MNVLYHFVHDVINCTNIIVSKITIHDHFADVITKSLPIAKFDHCLGLINIGC